MAARILGPDAALVTVVADAMQTSLTALGELGDARALRPWLVSGVIIAAKRRLKARRRWRWLGLHRRWDVPRDARLWSETLLASYRILDRMCDDHRIVFCLVVIHSMGLTEAASALGLSMSQVRTTFEKACHEFEQLCPCEPVLAVRMLRSA